MTVPWDDAGPFLRFSVTYEAADEAAEDALMAETKTRLKQLKLQYSLKRSNVAAHTRVPLACRPVRWASERVAGRRCGDGFGEPSYSSRARRVIVFGQLHELSQFDL